jgi:hypothetical protein
MTEVATTTLIFPDGNTDAGSPLTEVAMNSFPERVGSPSALRKNVAEVVHRKRRAAIFLRALSTYW